MHLFTNHESRGIKADFQETFTYGTAPPCDMPLRFEAPVCLRLSFNMADWLIHHAECAMTKPTNAI